MKKLTTNDFIRISKKIHGDKYNYDKAIYEGTNKKVKIICSIHGEFEQKARDHMKGCNCKYCVNNNIKLTTEEFIRRSKLIHNNKYGYDSVHYEKIDKKIKIMCYIHGEFEQSPSRHILGDGCSKCSDNYSDIETFIEKSNKIHNNKYDYSLVEYVNNKTKVKIICPIHGEFEQRPDNHIHGQNCKKCGLKIGNLKKTKKLFDFINESSKVHDQKYDYSLVEYINSRTKIKIICPNHGIFEQSPNRHSNGQGCPFCYCSVGENLISDILKNNNIKFVQNYTFSDCKDVNSLPFDFYLPEHNMCIEYDGIQHFRPIEYWGGLKMLNYIKGHDEIKNNYCNANEIKIIRIRYNENINEIMKNIIL